VTLSCVLMILLLPQFMCFKCLDGLHILCSVTFNPLSTSPFENIHSSLTNQSLCTQSGVIYAQITKQNSCAFTNIGQEPHINQSHQQTSNMQELKKMMKSLFEQIGTMINLLTTVLNRIKTSTTRLVEHQRPGTIQKN
jgi:hypothetical protein